MILQIISRFSKINYAREIIVTCKATQQYFHKLNLDWCCIKSALRDAGSEAMFFGS